jgi:hypothetical protein
MTAVTFVVASLAVSLASVVLVIVHRGRTVHLGTAHRADSEVHLGRAQAAAEVEEHDIDDMLGAIGEYRRRAGRREIGEELSDELLRGTWSD